MFRSPNETGRIWNGLAAGATVVIVALSSLLPSSYASAAALTPHAVSSGSSPTLDFAVSSFGLVPSISSARRLPVTFNPLSRTAVTHLAEDRRDGNVLLGPTTTFPALGNNLGIGDCTIVAVANVVAVAAIRFGSKLAAPTTAQAVTTWHDLNAGTAGGINDGTLLQAWAAPDGLLDTRIGGWASLNVTARRQMKEAILSTGGLYARLTIALSLPWTSLVWSNIPSSSAAVEGHAVALIGWTRSGWIAVSWGEIVLIPFTYWTAEGASAYAVSLLR